MEFFLALALCGNLEFSAMDSRGWKVFAVYPTAIRHIPTR
jgi:hypothetical protein